MMMLEIEGCGIEKIMVCLVGLFEVIVVYMINGVWDLIVEIGIEIFE